MTKKKKNKPIPLKNKIETVYALRHIESGKLLIMERSLNTGGYACNDYTVKLTHYYCGDPDPGEPIWDIDDAVNAEFVRNFSTEWYNSDERCPNHDYEPEELEVIEVHRVITMERVSVEIPSVRELFRLRYEEKDAAHYNYLMEELDKPYCDMKYSLYDLLILIEDGLWKPTEVEKDGRNNKLSKTKNKK